MRTGPPRRSARACSSKALPLGAPCAESPPGAVASGSDTTDDAPDSADSASDEAGPSSLSSASHSSSGGSQGQEYARRRRNLAVILADKGTQQFRRVLKRQARPVKSPAVGDRPASHKSNAQSQAFVRREQAHGVHIAAAGQTAAWRSTVRSTARI